MATAVQRARHEQRRVASIGYGFAGGAPPAVGGGALLEGEANGFAADFTHAVDAERVAVKTAGAVVYSPLSFFTSSGTSSKWVYDVTGALVNIPAGTLPINYDPVTHVARGLLVEPQATNLLVLSNGFAGGGWDIGAGLTRAQNASGPLGANTAHTLTMVAGTGSKWIYFNGPAAGNYRYSVYAKAGTLSWLGLDDGAGSATNGAFFNLSTGTVGTVVGRMSAATIEPVGNGWYRCSATVTGNVGFMAIGAHSADAQAVGWVATGGETLFISATQAETGTVATSYIPTTSASVTRARDDITLTPTAINYSATAGSWWVEHYPINTTSYPRVISNVNGAPIINYNEFLLFGVSDGTGLNSLTVPAMNGVVHKTAVAFTSGSRGITTDGLATQADTGQVTNLLDTGGTITFGGGSGVTGHCCIRKVRYLPRRPTNAELQSMTA